jgi:hypothetical protein
LIIKFNIIFVFLVIYDIKDPADSFYIIKKGSVVLESEDKIVKTNMIPTGIRTSYIQKRIQTIKKIVATKIECS